jgi:two-component system, OmpR family, phosphate regulon sensor histidine kinase PhoR
MSKNSGNNTFFYLAFRISLVISLTAFVIIFFTLWLHVPKITAFQYAFIGTIIILITSYEVVRYFIQKRIIRLETALVQLANKQFEELYEETYIRKDELDDVIIDLNKTILSTEKELQRLNRLENYRKEFIGDISHELKTPIFAIQGFIETLLDGALHDERVNRSFLAKAMRNVTRLNILTRDLMEISKLETGELRSDLQSVVLKDIISDVVENLQYKANNESIILKIGNIDPNIEVSADRNQLRQILINLIENGIKYNKPDGQVTVSARIYPKNPTKTQVSITDTGLGIEPRDIPRVTERFYRIDKSRAREKGGSGLGLSIVKHILEAHGEQLIIDSAINQGSTFSFTLQNAD